MWTTSSSPADRRCGREILLLTATLAFFLSSCRAGEAPSPDIAPDAPRAKAATSAEAEPLAAAPPGDFQQPELLDVTIRRLGDGQEPLAQITASAFLENATEPLVLEARLTPFPLPVGSSAPVLVLNGETLSDTTIHPGMAHTLVAFLPDRSALQAENRITVRWIGRESPEPPKALTLSRAEVEAQLEK